MTDTPFHRRLGLVALASVAGLVLAASPALATDDPAPSGAAPNGAAPNGAAPNGAAPAAGVPAPSSTRRSRTARKVRTRVRYRRRGAGACGGVRISLSGAGLAGVKRVDVRAGGHRVGRDGSRPYRMVIGGRRLSRSQRITLRLVGSGGVRTITRRLRACSSSRRVAARGSAFEPLPVVMALDALLARSVISAA